MHEFKFQKNVKNNLKLEFPFTEHAEELKQRINIVPITWKSTERDMKQYSLEETEKMNEHRGFNLFDYVPELKEWYK